MRRVASVRVALVDRDVPSYFRNLEHLLRYCARPAFALERLSLHPGRDGDPERIRYTLPRHKRGTWVGPGRRRKATARGRMASSISHRASFSTAWPTSCPRHEGIATDTTASAPRITRSEGP